MLYWIYEIITIGIAFVVCVELYNEKKWRIQIALALICIPLVLRILGIK
jgi:hypothetical protein